MHAAARRESDFCEKRVVCDSEGLAKQCHIRQRARLLLDAHTEHLRCFVTKLHKSHSLLKVRVSNRELLLNKKIEILPESRGKAARERRL